MMEEAAYVRTRYIVVLLMIWCPLIRGEFRCLCSYSIKQAVFQSRTTTAETIGFLNEFDCKPLYEPLADDRSWMAIQFEHKVGYVLMTPDDVIQQCLGSFYADQVTETPSTTTSSTHLSPTPTTHEPSTPPPPTKPITTHQPPTQPLQTQHSSTQPSNTQSIKTQPPTQYSITTQTMTTHTHTPQPITTQTSSHSQSATQSPTTQTPITQPTTRIHQMTTQQPISTTTPSLKTTTSLKTTKLFTIQSTKTTVHPTLTTIHTKPPLTTMHHAITYMRSTTHAPANSCPHNVVTYASHHHGYLMSRGDSCFELVNYTKDWTDAEQSCRQRGGHLTSVKNQAEENALLMFMFNHGGNHEVWIGLTDQHQEHHFKWSSGLPLEWTNWIPGKQNHFTNNNDDCVALFPNVSMVSAAYATSVGTWDDVHCDLSKPFICRFDAHPSSHLIG